MDEEPTKEFDFGLMSNSIKTDEEKINQEILSQPDSSVWILDEGLHIGGESVEDGERNLSEIRESLSSESNDKSPIINKSLEISNYSDHSSDFENDDMCNSILNNNLNEIYSNDLLESCKSFLSQNVRPATTQHTDFLENSKDLSRKVRPSTTHHIDLPEDIKDLGELYVKLYIKHPSLKNDIMKMYQLDNILEQKNQEYIKLCKKRSSENELKEIKPMAPRNKPLNSERTRKARIYTAFHPNAAEKQVSPPTNDRKIKSAAVNAKSAQNDQEGENSEVEITEEEKMRIETILQEDIKDSSFGYTPDKETEKLLQDINDKLKIFTSEMDDNNDEKMSNIQEDLQVSNDEKTSLKIDLQEWGCGLENKLHLRDIDNKLKVLKRKNIKEETNLSEVEIQKLIQESTKSLNRNKEHTEADNNSVAPNSSVDNLNSENWKLSKETLEDLLSQIYRDCNLQTHDCDADEPTVNEE